MYKNLDKLDNKNKKDLIISIVLAIIVSSPFFYFGFKILSNIESGSDVVTNTEDSDNKDNINYEKLGIITNLNSITNKKWSEENKDYNEYTNKQIFDIRYENTIGLKFGKLSVPSTNYISNIKTTIWNEQSIPTYSYYKVDFNRNNLFYSNKIGDFTNGGITMYLLDTKFWLNELHFYLINPKEQHGTDDIVSYWRDKRGAKIKEHNGWYFAQLDENNNVIFYKINNDMCFESQIFKFQNGNPNLKKFDLDSYYDFFVKLTENITFEKITSINGNYNYINFPNLTNISLSNNLEINLNEKVKVLNWSLSKIKNSYWANSIRLIGNDEKYTFELIEYSNRHNLDSDTYKFENYNFNGLEIEKIKLNGMFDGFKFNISDLDYHIYISNIHDKHTIITVEEENEFIKYVFDNIFIFK